MASNDTNLDDEMLSIWSEVFDRDDLTDGSDFFALGGDSLMAIRLMAKLRGQFAVRVPLRLVFKEPTLSGFTLAVRDLVNTAT
ncbi:MAG: phosphopantetheine-binding protein [Actinomycetota bacterium]